MWSIKDYLTFLLIIIVLLLSCCFHMNKKDREERAVAFFEESGISKQMQDKYLDGMVLSKNVAVVTLKKDEIVAQYQKPNDPQGFFYTCVTCDSNKIGILMAERVRKLYRAVKDTKVLKSTADKVVWVIEGKRKYTMGGELQILSTCLDCFEAVLN